MATKYKKIGTRHAHRVIAERKLGRRLRKGEIVHHIDGDSLNNDPSNIAVLKNQAEHARLHRTGMKLPPKMICKNGHALSGDNVYLKSSGSRRCLICERAYQAKWHRDKRRERALRLPGPKRGTAGAVAISESNRRRKGEQRAHRQT